MKALTIKSIQSTNPYVADIDVYVANLRAMHEPNELSATSIGRARSAWSKLHATVQSALAVDFTATVDNMGDAPVKSLETDQLADLFTVALATGRTASQVACATFLRVVQLTLLEMKVKTATVDDMVIATDRAKDVLGMNCKSYAWASATGGKMTAVTDGKNGKIADIEYLAKIHTRMRKFPDCVALADTVADLPTVRTTKTVATVADKTITAKATDGDALTEDERVKYGRDAVTTSLESTLTACINRATEVIETQADLADTRHALADLVSEIEEFISIERAK